MYLYSPGFSRLPQITSMARFSARSVTNRRNSRAGVIVAFARAFVEGTADWQLDVPPPREQRVSGEVDIDMPKQHRRAVTGFELHARHTVLDREGPAHR
jgi:hypothetical protein